MQNRFWNCTNPYQGDAKKVLCVCSAGLLRSPTAAKILWKEYGYNTRSCGLDIGHALIPIDDVLIAWADEIVCMTFEQEERLLKMGCTNVKCLNIPDNFRYMDAELCELIIQKYVS